MAPSVSADAVRDPARLAAVRRTGLLDTPSEPEFDRLTRLAARLLRVPVALVSLVDAERQVLKSCYGLAGELAARGETPVAHSVCRLVVAAREPVVIEDARVDPPLRDNPLVRELRMVAYAGVPLVTAAGQALGAFCVIDTRPRRWRADQIELLTTLAAAVVAEVELRGAAVAAAEQASLARAAAAERDELLEHIPEALFTVDARWRFIFVNRKAAALLGRTREELDGVELWGAFPALAGSELERGCRRAAAERVAVRFEAPFPPLPGWFDVHAEPRGGALSVYVRDVTARRQAEAALRQRDAELQQAQKMEAIGLLAGGVAHDFNNLLTVIRAHGEFLAAELADGSEARDDALEVVRAADRAAQLTRQLLAFSRRQTLDPQPLRPAELVATLGTMLRRVLGADVALRIDTWAPSGWTVADGGQLEQVVLNLAMNARDAMPDGGALTIEVCDVRRAAAEGAGVTAGDYVAIRVRDTGCGMSEPVRRRAFEPFFTTKEPGRGTGLGLSMAYGIVKQSGGELEIESAEGVGTTVTVLLRRAAAQGAARAGGAAVSGSVASDPGGESIAAAGAGRGTVLVVEDEDEVRGVVRQILERGGYEVLEARHGVEGEAAAAAHAGPIDLLLTDVVMPELSGRELASRVRVRHPETRVLYMSGYAPGSARGDGRPSAASLDAPCLQKPFTVGALVEAVRDRMDDPAP